MLKPEFQFYLREYWINLPKTNKKQSLESPCADLKQYKGTSLRRFCNF